MATTTEVVNKHHGVDFDVYVGRGSRWGNPYPLGPDDRETVIRRYEEYLRESPELLKALPEIQGKVLACFCAPRPCHGHILAAFADSLSATGAIPSNSVSDGLFPGPQRARLSFG